MPKTTEPVPSMSGKTCLVTGATSGIGAATAEALAGAGATVILVGRNREKCETTAARIRQATGNAAVDFVVADLSSQAEVRRLAREVLERFPRLDVLINNAGAMYDRRAESVDGIEMTWALNHLGYFLLTNLLLDRLKASAPSRIVNVSSDAHRSGRGIAWDDVEGKLRYRTFRAYVQSKLANLLFTFELARRLEGTGVTANALHPGFVWTSFFENKGQIGWFFKQLARVMSIPAEAGARTSVYLAASPEVDAVSGKYFDKCRAVASSRASLDRDAAARLWRLSEEATGLTGPD